LPTMGCAAAPKPATGLSLKQRMPRFCCRCAADRRQASLLRPSGKSSIAARTNKVSGPGFCAERVGVRLADDGLHSGPETCHWAQPETTHAPVYCRCAADRGQASLLRPSGRSGIAARTNKFTGPGFCAKRVGVRLADDGLRSGPKTGHWVQPETAHAPVYCRYAADRGQASLLRPSGRSGIAARTNKVSGPGFCAKRVGVRLADDGLRSGPETGHWVEPETTHAPVLLPLRGRSRASLAPTPSGQKRHRGAHKQGHRSRRLRGARRSPACRRWAAQRPRNLPLG